MFSIKTKFKRFGALLAALMLSMSLCCAPAFAAPGSDAADTESEALVDLVDEAEPDAEAVDGTVAAEEDNNPFGKSYIIKGVAVVGVGVAFYVVLTLKSKKK